MPVSIPLTNGFVAVVDDCDASLVASHVWYAHWQRGYWYVVANVVDGQGHRRTVLMHRLILGAAANQIVDHASGDTMDNRRSNLRFCSRGQNKQNATKRKPGRSRFKGVTFLPGNKRPWVARVRRDGVRRYLGCFATEQEAAAAYDAAASELFGEFARVNAAPSEGQGC